MSDDTQNLTQRTFLQQFCDKHNYEYHSLARPGASNFVINLQVDLAIKKRPDLIVIGGTSSDRINIVLDPDNWRAPLTIHNIVYEGYNTSSEKEVRSNRPTKVDFIASDTLANIVEAQYISVPDQTKKAVKNYIRDLYDNGLQYHIDGCIVRDSLNKLLRSGLDFIFIPGPMEPMGWEWLVGDRLWPKDQSQPWDMPYGGSKTVNHNTPQAHAMFLETLEQIAFDKGILKK